MYMTDQTSAGGNKSWRIRSKPSFTKRKTHFGSLTAAEDLSAFCNTKYVGQKRFSLEEARVSYYMDRLIQQWKSIQENCHWHRGRLNVLVNSLR
jgi:2-oxoglutarate dehydrogenase complex dehydrogenase (E1) component-like enzyme